MNKELCSIVKGCRNRQKELSHTVDVNSRAIAAIENRGWCELHTPELMVTHSSIKEEYWRLFRQWFGAKPENATEREIEDQIREARLYKFGRFAFLLVETIAGAVLAAIFFNAPRFVAMIIGVVLAVLLGAATSAMVTRWVRHGAACQPTKQLERITRALLVLGLPWLVACVTALAVLRSEGTGLGASFFFSSTTAVTLLSPLCSGLCGYAADLLLWSKRLCADLRWIRAVARDLDHLRVTSERMVPPQTGGSASPNPTPVDRVLKAIAPASMTLVLMGVLSDAAICRAADVPVYVYVDVSPSARPGEVVKNLKSLSNRLSTYEGKDALVVSVTPFFENAFMATSMVSVIIPGIPPVTCQIAGTDTEIARLSRTYAEISKRDVARQCDERRNRARQGAALQRSTESAKLNAAIDRLKEQTYIVDRLFDRANLVLGSGKKTQKVEITRGQPKG